MCTGRVDLSFILRAFRKGADGVIIGGCWPGECHYVTEGNYDALGNVYLMRKLLDQVGLNPRRLRIEWISAAEGARFAQVMTDFVEEQKKLGPLGEAEGLEPDELALKLEAVHRIVPYLKLMEREKLRVSEKSEQAYEKLYDSDQVARLFEEDIARKLAISRIMVLLENGPMSTQQISEKLGMPPSVIARHMNVSSRQGLVRYDLDEKLYALA